MVLQFIQHRRFEEGDQLLVAEDEPYIFKNCGVEGIMYFYTHKMWTQCELYKSAKSNEEKRTFMSTIELYVDKSRKLLVEFGKVYNCYPIRLLIQLALVDTLKQAFSEAISTIERIVSLEPLDSTSYDRLLILCNNVIPGCLQHNHKEEVRRLLRILAEHLRPSPVSPERTAMMLIDKLCYIVEFGRMLGQLDKVIDGLYQDILPRLELPTKRSIQHLHKVATRLNDMGFFKDALMFFQKHPTPIDKASIVAFATCNSYAGSPSESIRSITSIEESIERDGNQLETARCWRILSYSYGLENDQKNKERYAIKSWNIYLSLWR